MFVVALFGGLASQMNQFAFSRFLKRHYPSTEVKIFDATKWSPGGGIHNGYDLERAFGILPDTIDLSQINRLSSVYRGSGSYASLRSFLRRVKNRLFGTPKSEITVEDPTVKTDEMYHLNASQDLFFWGNYSNDYFEAASLSDEISCMFQFRSLPPEAASIGNEITSCESVSIHIRRGDYQACGFPLLGADYYQKAIDYLVPKVSPPHFFVFSDDVGAAQDTLSFLKHPVTYVSRFQGKFSYIDMQLMAMCHHNINANSGFSYWGARLNKHPDKIVVGPARHVPWCKNPLTDADWVKL